MDVNELNDDQLEAVAGGETLEELEELFVHPPIDPFAKPPSVLDRLADVPPFGEL